MTLEQLQELAFRIAGRNKPTAVVMNSLPTGDAAIYRHWKSNKHVGVPYTREYAIDEGGVAIITALGIILYWDTVSVREL